MKPASQTQPPPHRAPRRSRWPALVALLGLASSSCLGDVSTPRRVYYAIEYPRGRGVQVYRAPRYPLTVRIRRFEAALAYDRQEIVYRSSPYEIEYYAYRMWTAKPRKMLAKLVLSHLRQANLFPSVVDRVTEAIPEYDLYCEVLAIEELNASKKDWYARLAMRFWLTRFSDGTRVWQHEFDERRPVHERSPAFVVRTLSEILELQMRRIVDGLDVYFADATGAPLPEGGRLQEAIVRAPTEPADAGDPTSALVRPKAATPGATLKPKRPEPSAHLKRPQP